jgi:hypothetical protein
MTAMSCFLLIIIVAFRLSVGLYSHSLFVHVIVLPSLLLPLFLPLLNGVVHTFSRISRSSYSIHTHSYFVDVTRRQYGFSRSDPQERGNPYVSEEMCVVERYGKPYGAKRSMVVHVPNLINLVLLLLFFAICGLRIDLWFVFGVHFAVVFVGNRLLEERL